MLRLTQADCTFILGEYTTPEGDFKIIRKGIYGSVEDAQIGLKFSLKGGYYAHMIFEGQDITPELKGTMRVCYNVQYFDAIDDDPKRLYIWTKDLKGDLFVMLQTLKVTAVTDYSGYSPASAIYDRKYGTVLHSLAPISWLLSPHLGFCHCRP